MTHLSIENHGESPLFVAQRDQNFHHNYFGEGFVAPTIVPAHDFAASAAERFVVPSGDWQLAASILKNDRLLVLVADSGTGRRTAALHLLEKQCGIGKVSTLEPEWARPQTKLMPTVLRPEEAYLLDMTEPTAEQATEEFAKKLLDYVRTKRIYLVVTTTKPAWSGAWAAGVESQTVELGPPDPWQLVTAELSARGIADPKDLVAHQSYGQVWGSNPNAADMCRLVGIIMRNPQADPATIVSEYMDWRSDIDNDIPDGLAARALWWSGAFCDGGNQQSILRMAEALRKLLGENRSPATILADAPTSRRLTEAKLEVQIDKVRLLPGKHGFAAAVRRHLWEQFTDQTGLLTGWIVEQAASLPLADAELVVDAIFEIVVDRRDDYLMRCLRDKLVAGRRNLAVRVFTRGALDPRFGTHMRERLNTWVKGSPTADTVELVTEICGGLFGAEMPDQALVRLRHAAQRSQPDNPTLVQTINALAALHPRKVLLAIDAWISNANSELAGINCLLALASRPEGVQFLHHELGLTTGESAGESRLIEYFQTALENSDSADAADTVLEKWADFAEHGDLDTTATVEFLAVLYAPRLRDRILRRLLNSKESGNMDFWGQVLITATEPARNRG
ncbi:hypothetical protein GFY24_36265 [Nocardia sp. SYP-A9097]|uniref:hypothetical protein n=1 Tax=Nocardia sp. SYP-A9097 TaxID=2663237 RepID=UPI00129BF37E|nr:hypothetical protein [Nocardia sp. SYP-A9097]MRH92814.1 hypothetical protein [Nocardia sp. SYP-A9097]